MKKKTRIAVEKAAGHRKKLRTVGIAVLAAGAAAAVAVVIVRDQVARHRRDLFSPNVLQRLAALGYMARSPASVDSIMLLRDFIAWEPRRLLRGRAQTILARMEEEAQALEEKAAEKAS